MKEKELVIVVGGAGHVGSHLCEALIKEYKVISVDNYLTGKKENHIDEVVYIEDCATNLASLGLPKASIVFHLGEYARVEQSWKEPDFVFENNNINSVLRYCLENNSKLVYTCTSTIFDIKGEDLSPYTKSKIENKKKIEEILEDYSICYLSNVYGGRENSDEKYGTLIAKFLNNAKNDQTNIVTFPGTQTRRFTYINDVVNGILLASEKRGSDFIIASDHEYSILEVAEMINDNYEVSKEAVQGNRASSPIDNSTLKSLGWKETTTLEDYLNKYKEQI